MTRWADRLIVCAAVLTALVFIADTIVSVASDMYLNLGSGVWLGLARDAHDGLFYRPIWNAGEYGGTRYFPVLFVSIAGLMRLGLDAVSAGVIVSLLGLVAMAAAVAVFLKRLGAPSMLAVAAAALSIAPYFVHQTAYAIRCEPIAVAFAIFGLSAITPLEARATATSNVLLAAALFVAAFITKITCVYAPVASILALIVAGRRGAAAKLAIVTASGALLMLGLINLASGGRALESFRACALAGSSMLSLFSSEALWRAAQLIGTSHLLTVIFVATASAIIWWRRAWLALPTLYLLATVGVTAIIFTSPGTILTSQIVDAYVAAVVVLTTIVAAQSGRIRHIGSLILVGLAVWMAAQNISRVATFLRQGAIEAGRNDRRALIDAINTCGAPIISESALIPILAGQRPVLLDAFAFHVVSLKRPAVEEDLVERIRRREFTCVVLEQDPTTIKGRAWYSNVNLTKDVIDAVLQHYRLERTISGEQFFRAVQ
jgi:hypothetical protein